LKRKVKLVPVLVKSSVMDTNDTVTISFMNS